MLNTNPSKFPFNMALLFFFKSTLLLAKENDREGARPYLLGAMDISDLYYRIHTKSDNLQFYDLELQNVKSWCLNAMEMNEI